MAALFAATYPDRTTALILHGAFARRVRSDDYPWGQSRQEYVAFAQSLRENWGGAQGLEVRAPSKAEDPAFREWWATHLRMSASPAGIARLILMNGEIDLRPVLPAIRVPTLITHRSGDRAIMVENGRYLAAHIPGATYVELPGNDHLPFVGDAETLLDHIERFLTGAGPGHERDRVLATIALVECAPPTGSAASVRHAAWREHSAPYAERLDTELTRFRGRRIGGTEHERAYATFDGPARAIRFAAEMLGAGRALGLDVRAGVHTGECEVAGQRPTGPAVDVARGVLAAAVWGEVFVSGTVKDLVAGSHLLFRNRGVTRVAGLAGQWHLFSVERLDAEDA